jgi:hypothetical protein
VAGLADCRLNSRNMNVGRIKGMIVGLLEVGRCPEMEINKKKKKKERKKKTNKKILRESQINHRKYR